MTRLVYVNALGIVLLCNSVQAQDVAYPPIPGSHASEQLPPPKCTSVPDYNTGMPIRCTASDPAEYQADIRHWRQEERIRAGLLPGEYERDALRWTQSSYVQPQMMVHDRYFYDPRSGHYTVDHYLNDVTARYGGIDSVFIWPTYPNIGVDDRNQYDLFHDMPGGIAGMKQMIEDFHKRGVRVLFPTMLWDQGTRIEGKPDATAMTDELAEVDADGINGDTLEGMPRSFREASDALHHPLALEPELWLASDEMENYNNMSWGVLAVQFRPVGESLQVARD